MTPERAAGLARALRLVPPVDRAALYWTCRVALVTDRAQLPVFDAVFSAVFDGLLDPADSRGDPTAPPADRLGAAHPRRRAPDRRPEPAGTAPEGGAGAASGGDGDGGDRARGPAGRGSTEERLRHDVVRRR